MHRTSVAVFTVLTVAALSFASRPAHAGDWREHDGFQFRGAVGAGYLSDSESDATLHGGAGVLEVYLGGMPIPGLAIGGFLSGVTAVGPSVSVNNVLEASVSDTNLTLVTVGPYIDYYPNPHRGFHILGTVGFARLTASFDDGTFNASDSGTGFTLGGGIGYDWWVSRDWTVGILGRFTFASTTRDIGDLSVTQSSVLPALLFSVSYN